MREVRGVPLLEPMVAHWDRVEAFQAFPEDVLIATYPKAGEEPGDTSLEIGSVQMKKYLHPALSSTQYDSFTVINMIECIFPLLEMI